MPCPASFNLSQLEYKGQGVPFPPDLRAKLPRYLEPTIWVSLGAQGYRTSRSVKTRGSQKQGSPPVAGDAARPSALPQDNREVLKKLRELQLGALCLSVALGKSITS